MSPWENLPNRATQFAPNALTQRQKSDIWIRNFTGHVTHLDLLSVVENWILLFLTYF